MKTLQQKIDEKELLLVEDVNIYNEWVGVYDVKNKEFIWRDEWFTNRIAPEKKEQLKKQYEEKFKIEK